VETDRLSRKSVSAILLLVSCTILLAGASASSAANYLQPGATPEPGAPPPLGSGGIPQPLIQGDAPANQQPPPTGQADATTGSRFGTRPETVPTPNNNQGQSAPYPTGIIAAPQQRRLMYDSNTGSYVVDAGIVQSSLRDRNMIDNDDGPVGGTLNDPTDAWRVYENANFPLRSVKPFCKILVILGVVFATFYMICAAYGVIMGHKDSGNRVIGTAAGLILLLMGYTIYKIVMLNALRIAAAPERLDEIRTQPMRNQQALQNNDTPGLRAAPGNRPRSNLQVSPFASHP
jgi:hypothetical protein